MAQGDGAKIVTVMNMVAHRRRVYLENRVRNMERLEEEVVRWLRIHRGKVVEALNMEEGEACMVGVLGVLGEEGKAASVRRVWRNDREAVWRRVEEETGVRCWVEEDGSVYVWIGI